MWFESTRFHSKMEIVVQMAECQIVALVVTGSSPVILPKCFGSSVG